MTTLVALATKDSLVLGCDSLGSVTKWMIDPSVVFNEFFDANSKLKIGQDGKSVLQEFDDLYHYCPVKVLKKFE